MKKNVVAAVVALLLVGGAFGLGWWQGKTRGYRSGFADGTRRGEIQAARKAPPPVRNQQHSLAALAATAAWSALPELAEGEGEALVGVLNEAPTPCKKDARRGISLATALLDPESECASAPGGVRLGLAALRTFPDDPGEALAVLRVETRVAPSTEGRARRGNPDADVVLVEWSDFQCPYCTRAQRPIHGLLEARDDVAFVYKHMPLSFHPAAYPAALAVEAAGKQGRFWEMHDALFDLGKGIGDHVDKEVPVPPAGPVPFESLAEELGLDVERYRADFRSDEVEAIVAADREEAAALGVNGTPTFFVGDRRVRERLSVPVLTALVDKAKGEREYRFAWDLEPSKQ